MPAIGIIIKSIDATKDKELIGNVKVNNEVKVIDVVEKDMPGLNKKGLSVNFKYSSMYTAEENPLAHIIISGDVLYIDDTNKVLDHWKKENKLPEDVNLEVINSVFRKCIIKALGFADELQLPAPIAMPYASGEKK